MASAPALAKTVLQAAPDRAAVLATMKRAARFMTDEAAVEAHRASDYFKTLGRAMCVP